MLFMSALAIPGVEHNAIHVVSNVLDTLKVKISNPTVKKVLEEHPDYPSLLSISDALTGWKIENISIKTELEKLRELPLPFVVAMQDTAMPYFAVVKSITDKGLLLSHKNKRGLKEIGWTDFARDWKGIVMLLEPQEEAGESEYKIKQNSYRLKQILPLAAILFIISLWLAQSASILVSNGWGAWAPVALMALKAFGCYIATLLLWYEVDKQNAALQKVCKAGKNINCHAVLQSSASTVLGVSWGEVGFIYFAGSFLSLLTSDSTPFSLSLLAWLNVLALPYTVFSIYYQWKVVKQWCLLCISVQIVLALEFVVNITGSLYGNVALLGYEPLKNLLFFLVPAFGWFLLKPSLLLAKESKKNQNELSRLKHNIQIFESLLSRQKSIEHDPHGLGITLGNPDGKFKLIKVCNPYCGPCANAHPDMEELLHNNPDLQVQIIFTASNAENDKMAKPVKHLLAVAEKQNELMTKQALDDWYNAPVKDYELFADKYRMNGELQKQGHKLEAMSRWCKETGIAYTPTFFVQGHELPGMYTIKDLKYFYRE